MSEIVFQREAYSRLRQTLLGQAPKEAGAILLGGYAKKLGETRLLVRNVIKVPPEAYQTQDDLRLVISPTFIAPLLKQARGEGWSIVFVHSHPFSNGAQFSSVDDEGEGILMPSIFARAPERPHGTLVVAQEGFAARIYTAENDRSNVDFVREVGPFIHTFGDRAQNGSIEAFLERSVRALGEEGQNLIRRSRIGVVGLGGTGSIVAQQLAHLGVKEFIFLDDDIVEETNLNRLVGSGPKDAGRPKVEVAADFVHRIQSKTSVNAIRGSVLKATDARPLLGLDFIFCCTDTQGSRAVLNQLAYQYLIPVIDLGVRIDAFEGLVSTIAGRVQMLAPGLPCLVCQNLLDPEAVRRDLLSAEERARDPYIVGSQEAQPAVISLNGTTASLAVTMLLSAVAGLPMKARHQIYLADRGIVRAVESAPVNGCVVCSERGSLARGDLWPLPWRTA